MDIVGLINKRYKGLMRHIFSIVMLVGLVVVVTACSSPPYINKSGQFNRAASNFGQPVSDISSVTVCYSSYASSPQQVSKLAVDACAAFNKTAKFSRQRYDVCPVVAPIAAEYSCLGGTGVAGSRDAQAVSGGTLINYDGIPFRY